MTRTHAAYQLLRHGSLSLPSFVEITGWKYQSCVRALERLRLSGKVRATHRGTVAHPSVYEVVS